MAGVSGSKCVKFGKIYRAPWEFAKAGPFNAAYEDPTYLTFKVEFGGWGRSQKELVNANIYIDDAEFNNVWDANFDDYPMGLFDMNFKLPNGSNDSFYSKTDTYGTVSRYNAVNWLYTRHEDARAEYLKAFVEGLTSLQTYYPHFITSVTGVDSLIDFAAERGSRLKNDTKLTFTFNDSIDQRVRTLFELYRKAAWDDEYQRWALPENLREFKMILYISEIRDFHRPAQKDSSQTSSSRNLFNRVKNTIVDKVSDLINGWVFTNGQDAVEYGGNNIAPVYAFECSPCQFEIGPLFNADYKSYAEGNDEQIKVSVKVKNVRTYMKNSVIDKIDNFIISDQISIYKRFYGSKNADTTSNIDAPYNSWLRRDFFTSLYENATADPSSYITTYGTKGTIDDYSLLSAYNPEIFSMVTTLNGASSLGGILSANVKRLLGKSPKEMLGIIKNSFSEQVEDFILSSLSQNLKKIAMLDDGLFIDKIVTEQALANMMNDARQALANMKMHDESYLKSVENGMGALMDKLEHDQKLLESAYIAGADLVVRLKEQRTNLMNGAPLEGIDPNLEMNDVSLTETKLDIEFQDMPIEDTEVDIQFNKVELDKSAPSVQFNNMELEDPSINIEFQDMPLQDTELNLQFIDTQLDLTSPELIFNSISLEEPELDLKFQDAPLQDTELNLQFNAPELETPELDLKFQDAPLQDTELNLQFNAPEIESTELDLKFQDAPLQDTELNLQFNAPEIESTELDLKFNAPELENTKLDLKFQDAPLQETENNIQFNPTKLEEVENNIQFNQTKLEETENNIQFNPTKLEDVENNIQFNQTKLEETENTVKFNPTKLEDVENNIQFNPTKLEEVENNIQFNQTKLEETKNNQNFVDFKLKDVVHSHDLINQELVETTYDTELRKVALEEINNKIQFKNVQLENLDNYISQLKQKIEELKNYKAIIEDDKEKGYGTKIKTLDLLNSVIDTNIEVEKQLNSAKLIMTEMNNIETHTMNMKDAELEKPAPKQTKILSGGLIDDYEPLTEIQPIDDALEFKEKFRKGYVRSEESKF